MIKELIHDLGGPKTLSKLLSGSELRISPNGITKWGMKEHVPWQWRMGVRRIAEEKGRALTAEEARALEPDASRAA